LANSFLTETSFVEQVEMSVGKVVFDEMTRARLNTGNQSFVSSISFQEKNTKLASTIEIRPECARPQKCFLISNYYVGCLWAQRLVLTQSKEAVF
jgi:hypothetical protein